jgi:hypothetical protein
MIERRIERLERRTVDRLKVTLAALTVEDLEALSCPTLQAMDTADLERLAAGGDPPAGVSLEPLSAEGERVLGKVGGRQ